MDRVEIWGDHPGEASRQLGTASFGSARPDIGAAFGSRFTNCGWDFTVNGIAAGNWSLSAKLIGPGNQLLMAQQMIVVIEDGLRLNVDSPVSGSVLSPGTQVHSSWALDVGAASGHGHCGSACLGGAEQRPGGNLAGLRHAGRLSAGRGAGAWQSIPTRRVHAPVLPAARRLQHHHHALRTRTKTFDAAQVVHVAIQGSRVIAMIDAPAVNATNTSGSLTVVGWAIDPDSQAGSGILGGACGP